MQFVVDLKVRSWNTIACKHWRVYKAAADESKWSVLQAINQHKLKKLELFPVKIHFHAVWKKKMRHDIDALYCKGVLDQLVASKILPDDSLEYVRAVLYTGETGGKKDELFVTISGI